MSIMEIGLDILEKVEFIKMYVGADDNLFYAEVCFTRYNKQGPYKDFASFSAISFEEIVVKVNDWLCAE